MQPVDYLQGAMQWAAVAESALHSATHMSRHASQGKEEGLACFLYVLAVSCGSKVFL